MKRGIITAITILTLGLIMGAMACAGDKPTIDLKWYGYFKVDGAYDRNLSSHGNYIVYVQQRTASGHDNQFNLTANETRFGFTATGAGYNNVKVSGKLEFDLYASVTGAAVAENKAMIQLRHAFFTLESGHYKMLAGQSSDIIAPLVPSTLNYTALLGAGNIGYRRPQVSFWYNTKAGAKTDVTLACGFFRTIGNDLTPTFTLAQGESIEGADDGTDAGIPSFQMLGEFKKSTSSGGTIRAGLSGHYGSLKAETNQGHSEKYESWVVAGHLQIAPSSKYGFSGEIYTGSNLGSYFGAILRNSEIKGLSDGGGWISAWTQVSPKVQLSAGYSIDDPDNKDFSSGRSRNSCVYSNIRYSLVPQATLGMELSNWRTDYKNAAPAKDFRMQTSLILNF